MTKATLISLPASDGAEDALRALRCVLQGEVLCDYDRTSLLRLAAALEGAENYDPDERYNAGYDDGYRDGRDAGYADAEREFSDRIEAERADAAARGYTAGYSAGIRDEADRAERFGAINERARERALRGRGDAPRDEEGR